MQINQTCVLLILAVTVHRALATTVTGCSYKSLGCWRDTSNRAIPTLEGTDNRLIGNYRERNNAPELCFQVAKSKGYAAFAVQNGGWCAGSSTALNTYRKYGVLNYCKDGKGGSWANDVYQITCDAVTVHRALATTVAGCSYKSLGCWRDARNRAIPTLEGTDNRLIGNYRERNNATELCFQVAKSKDYPAFAVQNGGWCAGSSTALNTYKKYGVSTRCKDGKGGNWANDVYQITCDGDENENKCLTSPGYPKNYPNNANISQTLSVPAGQSMEITFQDFDVEDEDEGWLCPYDYVEFSDENGTIIGNKLCGDLLPQNFNISTSSATVLFHSDWSVTRKGFKFCYKPGGQRGQWESWGQCSSTCGQGIQIRRRSCSDTICPGFIVDQRQCMGSKRRIRRNVTSLSFTEKERLQKALSMAIESTRPWQNYQDLGNFHGAPTTLCSNKNPPWCCPHDLRTFLPWHRLYTVQMEQILNSSLPYWDWTETGDVPDLWEDIAGPIKKPHFSNSNNFFCLGNDNTHHSRGRNIILNTANLKRWTRMALEKTNFEEFYEQIEVPHNMVHGSMGCDMADIRTAAYDPVFYLHHAYVDYQFAFWQELQRLRKESGEISEEINLSSHNTLLEPFNRLENNPFQITQRNSQGRNTFDYRNNLCYEYETLIFDGKTPEEFLQAIRLPDVPVRINQNQRTNKSSNQICKNDPVCRVFVGIILPKNVPTSLIEFQICTRQNRCFYAGSVATFGPTVSKIGDIINFVTNSSRSLNDYYLVEYEVTDTFKKEAIFNGDLTARISSVDNPSVTIGLDPVMIWRYRGGVERGTAYLSQGSRRKDYGTLLDKFDDVVENIVG